MKTFSIAIEKIENDAAKQLIKLCAFLAPENINCQWFTDAGSVLPQPLQDAVKDDYLYQKVKKALAAYSLVKIENNKINMHRLVQEVVKESLKNEQAKWINYCIDILDKQLYSDFSTAEARSVFTGMIPHILSVTAYPCHEKQEEVANLYNFMGYGFDELANYEEALNYYQKALEIREKALGKKHPDTATNYNNIGAIYSNQGDYDKALEYYQTALDIHEKALGKEYPDTATNYNNIGAIYSNQGDSAKALEYLQKTIEIQEKVLGKEHPDTAASYNNIGFVYSNQGDHAKALEYYQKALDI
jgi:tetratricopeptide (TPR) repeat protein